MRSWLVASYTGVWRIQIFGIVLILLEITAILCSICPPLRSFQRGCSCLWGSDYFEATVTLRICRKKWKIEHYCVFIERKFRFFLHHLVAMLFGCKVFVCSTECKHWRTISVEKGCGDTMGHGELAFALGFFIELYIRALSFSSESSDPLRQFSGLKRKIVGRIMVSPSDQIRF